MAIHVRLMQSRLSKWLHRLRYLHIALTQYLERGPPLSVLFALIKSREAGRGGGNFPPHWPLVAANVKEAELWFLTIVPPP